MDWMSKRFGGRKFVMAIIVIAAAMFLEVSGHGLSTTMAGFLGAVLAAFSATNVISSTKAMGSRGGGDDKVSQQVAEIRQLMGEGYNQENIGLVINALTKNNQDLEQIKSLSSDLSKGMINLLSKR